MSTNDKEHITRISKEFASGFDELTGGQIAGSGFIVVDPLSGYLNYLGYNNTLHQIPATDSHPQVLIMTFDDGSIFIPAASDLPTDVKLVDWMWFDSESFKP